MRLSGQILHFFFAFPGTFVQKYHKRLFSRRCLIENSTLCPYNLENTFIPFPVKNIVIQKVK